MTRAISELLVRFEDHVARVRDCEVIFQAGLDREAERREEAISNDDSWVQYDEDGPMLKDEGEFYDRQQERVVAMHGEIETSRSFHEQVLRVGLHHSVEVFMRALAIESGRFLGLNSPPAEDSFDAPKWFKAAGVDLLLLPHADRLVIVRNRVGSWKHTGFSDARHIARFMRETYTPAAFLDMDSRDHEPVAKLASAVTEFAAALVATVQELISERERKSP